MFIYCFVLAFSCSIQQFQELFFGGYPSISVLAAKKNKLLGVSENDDSTRNPPWIQCCVELHLANEAGALGARHYHIRFTNLVLQLYYLFVTCAHLRSRIVFLVLPILYVCCCFEGAQHSGTTRCMYCGLLRPYHMYFQKCPRSFILFLDQFVVQNFLVIIVHALALFGASFGLDPIVL